MHIIIKPESVWCGEWAGWRGTGWPNCLARPNSQARTGTGKKNIFPVQLIPSRIGNLLALMDQPGKVANPARGQLNRENVFTCPRLCLKIWSRETGSAVPSRVSLLISILRLNLVLTGFLPSSAAASIYLFI